MVGQNLADGVFRDYDFILIDMQQPLTVTHPRGPSNIDRLHMFEMVRSRGAPLRPVLTVHYKGYDAAFAKRVIKMVIRRIKKDIYVLGAEG